MTTTVEDDDKMGKEGFSLMKNWLLAKIQGSPSSYNESGRRSVLRSDSVSTTTGLPKIVISRGSQKSINSIKSPSPRLRRPPSPLRKTWINYEELSTKVSVSVPHDCSKSFTFWNSPRSFVKGKKRKSESTPCSPVYQTQLGTLDVRCREKSEKDKIDENEAKYDRKLNIPMYDNVNNAAWSPYTTRSVLDSPSMCGFCGNRKFSDSCELVGFEPSCNTPYNGSCSTSAVNSPRLKQKRPLGLRRTSSCRTPHELETSGLNKAEVITKARSNMDLKKRTWASVKKVKSRHTLRSTISLTRSWSINLETFRIVKSDSLKTNDTDKYGRKLSLNDNELRGVADRRRSSLLRIFCGDNSDTDKDEPPEDSSSTEGCESDSEKPSYSPKVTRGPTFFAESSLNDFKSTFESDTTPAPGEFGQIKIMFQFFNEKEEFTITLLKGANVYPKVFETLGIYAKMCLMPGKKQSQKGTDKHDSTDPVFYETFSFKVTLGELLDSELRIKMYNKPGIFSTSQPISECYISLYHYDLTAVTVIWMNLQECRSRAKGTDSQKRTHGCLKHFLCGM